jgi:adenine deaminase
MDWPGRENLERMLAVARGDEPADLVLHGGKVADLFGNRLMETQVAVASGRIVGLGEYKAKERIDLEGGVLVPSFIDGHIHIESTLLTPPELARVVVPWGTGGLVADPHEIANVAGLDGIRYMMEVSEGLDLKILFMAPSCVPACPLETSGAVLEADDLAALIDDPRIPGLAEVMNFPGVVAGDKGLLDKIQLFKDQIIDGHAPLLSGPALNAYILGGPGSDHECSTLEEARDKLTRGQWIMVRQGSTCRNMEALAPLINTATAARMMLVTDDNHPDDLITRGHLNPNLARAVELGVAPLTALRMATLNPATYFGLRGRGAVAPGYTADLAVLDDLEGFNPRMVLHGGRIVARGGEYLGEGTPAAAPPPALLKSMKAAPYSLEDLAIPVRPGKVRVIGLKPGEVLTDELLLEPPVREGLVVAEAGSDLLKLAVVERHQGSGNLALGLVRGLGLERGALASSVAHDAHNIIGAGASDEDLFRALKRVEEMGGGLVVAAGGRIRAELGLPLGGLMSLDPGPEVAQGLTRLHRAARDLGCPFDPFMALSFLALAVIPALKITDQGLVDVFKMEVVDLFAG